MLSEIFSKTSCKFNWLALRQTSTGFRAFLLKRSLIVNPMLSGRVRLEEHFDEFRKNRFFVDAWYRSSDGDSHVHKLLLARRSSFFSRAFQRVQVTELPVVLNISNRFDAIIEFIYTNRLSLERYNATELIEIYILACFYGVDNITSLLRDAITAEFLTSKHLQDKPEQILEWVQVYRSQNVTNTLEQLQSLIQEREEIVAESQLMFLDFIVTNWDYLSSGFLPRICQTLPTRLFAHVVRKVCNSNETVVELVDQFFEGLKSSDDRVVSEFDGLIDWSIPNAYRVFTKGALGWVRPEISRKELCDLLAARRRTIAAMRQEVNKLKTVTKASRWYVSHWCEQVRDASGLEKLPSVRLMEFVSTLGGAITRRDFSLYGFVRGQGSQALGKKEHGMFCADVLFDGSSSEERYFASDPLLPHSEFQISFEFCSFAFRVESIQLSLVKDLDESVEFVCAGAKGGSTMWHAKGTRPDSNTIEFIPSRKVGITSATISFSPKTQKIQTVIVVRAKRLEVIGTFAV